MSVTSASEHLLGVEEAMLTLRRLGNVVNSLLNSGDVVSLLVGDLLLTPFKMQEQKVSVHPLSDQTSPSNDMVAMLTIENSSSIAMTTSTASKESRPRSVVNEEVAETLEGSTFSKVFKTSTIRDSMSDLLKPADAA